MATVEVHIVSAEAEIFKGEASAVFASASEGEVGIFPGHSPLLTKLRPGEVRIQDEDGGDRQFYVSGGILEAQPHAVTILADTALRSDDLDEARALEAKKRAEEMLESQGSDIDTAAAFAEIAQAAAQLRMIDELRKKRK